jgi:hypothetical protein
MVRNMFSEKSYHTSVLMDLASGEYGICSAQMRDGLSGSFGRLGLFGILCEIRSKYITSTTSL